MCRKEPIKLKLSTHIRPKIFIDQLSAEVQNPKKAEPHVEPIYALCNPDCADDQNPFLCRMCKMKRNGAFDQKRQKFRHARFGKD